MRVVKHPIRRAAPRVPPGLRDVTMTAFWFSVMLLRVKVAGRRLPS